MQRRLFDGDGVLAQEEVAEEEEEEVEEVVVGVMHPLFAFPGGGCVLHLQFCCCYFTQPCCGVACVRVICDQQALIR